VTHDQTEAMSLGHRVAVLRDGRIEQAGSPQEVYDRPATAFVAGFLGSPGMNLLPGRLEAMAGGARLRLGEAALDLPGAAQTPREVLAGLRPEALRLPPAPGDAALPARVEALEELGHEVLVHARLPGAEAPLTARAPHGTRPAAGEQVALGCRPGALHLFDPASGARLPEA
jgi:multiple sugar transport system ATP-binding protein